MKKSKGKTSHIISDLFLQMAAVNIVINMIQPCNQLIDTILTGKAYGAYALQAYALFLPVNSLLIAVSCIISKGAQISCSHLTGRGEFEETHSQSGFAFLTGVIVSVIFAVLFILFSKQIAVLLGASPDIPNQIQDISGYLRAYALGIPAIFLLDLLMCLTQLEGKKKIVVCSSLCVLVVNAAGDLLNIFIFKKGLFGMALATSAANIVATAVMYLYFRKRSDLFRLSLKDAKKKYLLNILKNGLPGFTYYGSLVIRAAFLNMLIITRLDRSVLVSMLVFNHFATITDVLIGGCGDSVLLLGGVLFGEKDKKGAKQLVRFASGTGAALLAAAAVITVIFAVPFSKLFLSREDYIYAAAAARALRIAALYLVPDVLACVLKKYIQAIGSGLYTSIINILCNVVYVCCAAAILTKLMGSDGLFLSFTVCYVLALITNCIYVYFRADRKFGIPDGKILEYSIGTLAECAAASENAYHDCGKMGVDHKKQYLISLFVEEMTKNIVEHGFQEGKNNSIVVRIMMPEDRISINIKDNCRHFDPKHYYDSVKKQEKATTGFGIRMIMELSKSVVYTNSLNLNNLYIEL